MSLPATYSDACQHILLPDSGIKCYGLCRHTMCPYLILGLPVLTLAAHIHMRTVHFFVVTVLLIVSGVVSYLERCEGDYCLMCVCVCVSQLTIVQPVTVVMLCGWGRSVGLKAC
jgi:hypothetical protein